MENNVGYCDIYAFKDSKIMIEFRNKIFVGANKRRSLFDCNIPEKSKAVIIFMHGYKGYKDWGAWNVLEQRFLEDGFGFVKFNVAHNGGTVEAPIDFSDLEAFGRNRYTYELEDLSSMVSEVDRMIHQELQLDIPIYLLGHSRGGGVCVLQAARDKRISKVASLAGIADIERRWPVGEDLVDWEREGLRYVFNGRTRQNMPHFYSFYEDWVENKEMLDIESAAKSLKIPFLQVHGDVDEAVSISEGRELAEWTGTEMKIVKGADHTFGTSQPWTEPELPYEMERAYEALLGFFKS